jgi:O-antigen/teichoic acid export membrane protein
MAAGFISFPILTRIFSVGDYGILGMMTTTVFIVIAVAKLGFPAWIAQFYAEFKANKRLDIFQSTMFITSVGGSAIIAILFYIASQFFRGNIQETKIISLIPFVCVAIFTSCTSDILITFLRAEQKTKLYNLFATVRRYGSLALSILLALFVVKGLYGFYFGAMLAGIMGLAFLIYVSKEEFKISVNKFSTGVLKDSIRFGLPLVGGEMSHLILNYADRYLIQLYLGSTSLGLYIAGYNLATYVTEIIIYPINYAITPIYMKMLVNKGEEEVRKFFTTVFSYFFVIMLPIVLGFIVVGKDVIRIFAGSKYLEAHSILPYVVIGQSIYACSLILNNGLFIKRKTYIYTPVIAVSSLVNIGLNLILIPHFGILGAAQATLISNTLYVIAITYFAFREFSFPIDYSRILLYLVVGIAMYFLVGVIDAGTPIKNLVAKIVTGAVFYSALVLIFDRDLRIAVFRLIDRSRRKDLRLPLR